MRTRSFEANQPKVRQARTRLLPLRSLSSTPSTNACSAATAPVRGGHDSGPARVPSWVTGTLEVCATHVLSVFLPGDPAGLKRAAAGRARAGGAAAAAEMPHRLCLHLRERPSGFRGIPDVLIAGSFKTTHLPH